MALTKQNYIDRLRNWIGDTIALNVLEDAQETTDDYLLECIEDALEEANTEFGYESSFTLPWLETGIAMSWSLLKRGSVLHYLVGKGILSARNTLTYNDTGGVTVQDFDRYGRYVNYYNVLITKWREGVMNFKRTKNVEAGYGGVWSEFDEGWWGGYKY